MDTDLVVEYGNFCVQTFDPKGFVHSYAFHTLCQPPEAFVVQRSTHLEWRDKFKFQYRMTYELDRQVLYCKAVHPPTEWWACEGAPWILV